MPDGSDPKDFTANPDRGPELYLAAGFSKHHLHRPLKLLVVIVWVSPCEVQKLSILTQLPMAGLDYMPRGWISGLAVIL
jgi:hypothetical protein